MEVHRVGEQVFEVFSPVISFVFNVQEIPEVHTPLTIDEPIPGNLVAELSP